MPLFDFRCAECKEVFELLVPAANDKPRCPNCHLALERMLPEHTTFHLKGGGWSRGADGGVGEAPQKGRR
jgi:putative FmdB family regulatory protein